jgi:hypothetical protein
LILLHQILEVMAAVTFIVGDQNFHAKVPRTGI